MKRKQRIPTKTNYNSEFWTGVLPTNHKHTKKIIVQSDSFFSFLGSSPDKGGEAWNKNWFSNMLTFLLPVAFELVQQGKQDESNRLHLRSKTEPPTKKWNKISFSVDTKVHFFLQMTGFALPG